MPHSIAKNGDAVKDNFASSVGLLRRQSQPRAAYLRPGRRHNLDIDPTRNAMLVFIDSNQYIADYWLRSASFYYLLRFIKNEGHTLLLSRLVLQEVENKFSEHVAKARDEATKVADRLVQLGFAVHPDMTNLTPPRLSLEHRLRNEVENLLVVEYDHIAHKDVVQRSLTRKKPFDAEGHNGYRDCLIWLSVMQFLAEHPNTGEEVAFISNNTSDFYRPVGKQAKQNSTADATQPRFQFHDDLAADLPGLSQILSPYESVAAFVESKVDKTQHAVDYDKRYELFEDFLEDEGLAVLRHLNQGVGPTILKSLLGNVAGSLTVLDSDADVTEGMEDLDIRSAELVDGKVYVSCTYNLRIVTADVFIPKTQVEEHRPELIAGPNVWEVEDLGETAAIRLSLRAYYEAAFTFDPKTEDCGGFSLLGVHVK